MGSMLPHFLMFAEYNRWANRRLHDCARMLTEAEFAADRGAIFGSIRGILNHILVTDRSWLARVSGKAPTSLPLDAIVHEQLGALDEARRLEDERIIAFVGALDEQSLDRPVRYALRKTPDDIIVQPLREALAHWFNHQTHHRGQVHTLLTIAGGNSAAPSLDLVLFQRSDEYREMR